MANGKRVFTCENCDVKLEDTDQLKAHMKDVHNNTELKGTKQMVSHMDGRDWFGGVNRWTFGDVVIIESYQYERDEQTRMY